MYPKVFADFAAYQKKYGDVSPVPTDVKFYGLRKGEETEVEIEKGKTLFIRLQAVSEPNERGMRTLYFDLNGHPREVEVLDRRLGKEVAARPKADRDNLHHLGSPMPGTVVEVKAAAGDEVKEGDKLVVLEAMKMEIPVHSPFDGTVTNVHVATGDRVAGGALLAELES
jgi:pyruvate carboxylase